MSVWFIGPSGSDSNPGTSQASPFATFGKADTVALAGDTIVVLPGTYTIATSMSTTKNGTSTQRITWTSPTYGAAKLVGTMNNTVLWDAKGNYCDYLGFDISGALAKIGLSNSGGFCSVKHCTFHDLGTNLGNTATGAGCFDFADNVINGNIGNNEYAYNVAARCGTAGQANTFYHGFYFSMQQNWIHHNIASNCSGFGFHIFGDLGTVQNVTCANNLIFSCAYGGFQIANSSGAVADHIGLINNIIINNGLYGGAGYGIQEVAGNTGTHNIYDHNLTFGNSNSAYVLQNGLVATNQILSNPTFRSYKADGSGDYHPVRPGPTISSGTGTLPAWLPAQFGWSVDMDGVAVPQGSGFDVGPYELRVSGAPVAALIGGASANVVAGSLHVENQIGQRSTGGLQVWTNLGVTYQYGTQVKVYDDTGALAYSGYTTKDKITKKGGARQGTGQLEHDLSLMDNCYRADKRRVFKTYLATSAGTIVKDLLGTYLAPEGVTATATSIATGPNITEVIWSGTKSVGEALTWLSTQAGYWWNIDVNGVLFFQPYSGIPAPLTIDGTQLDALKDMSCEFGNDMYVNKQFAKGGYAELAVQTETYHGDGVRRNWTLSYPIARLSGTDKKSGQTLGVKLNGVSQTLGTKGVDNGQPFYYATGDAVLAQDAAQTVLTSGDTLVVTYIGRFPALAAAQNPALIAAQQAREGGGTGLVESTYTDVKVHTLSAAFQIASALLSHYGQDTTILTFATRTKGLMPGQMLGVNLPDFNLTNKQMLISSVTVSDQVDGYNVWFVVQAVGSPVESAQWQTYWTNLMSQSSDPTDRQDISDTNLALLLASTVLLTWSGTVTKTTAVCPICNNATLCGNSTIIC